MKYNIDDIDDVIGLRLSHNLCIYLPSVSATRYNPKTKIMMELIVDKP